MANLKVLLVISTAILSAFGAGSDGIAYVPPQPPVETTTDSPNPTTTKPTAPTTPKPTTPVTTPAPTPSPTTKPSTTPAPVTTTSAPTTSKPTSPAPPTPTTPAPTPVDPKMGNWTVDYANTNRSCIFLEAAIQYEILDSKTNKSIKINVPVDATATGTCEGATNQSLVVSWGTTNSLQFDFLKLNTSKFELGDIISTLNVTAQGQLYNLVHNKSEFSVPLQNSYKCAKVQTLNLTEPNSNVTVAYLHVSHLQYQAFRNSTEHKFDTALDCEGSVTPDIVPIVVGCVLAALVVMVLIAYLVGRRRCQARGYLSMFAETKREEDYIPMKNLSCFN